MAVSAAETAMVGDSEVDMAAARNSGLRSVAVSYGYARVAPADLDADELIDTFDQLPEALTRLSARP